VFGTAEWEALLMRLKPDSSGNFMWEEFFSLFSYGQEDEKLSSMVGTVRNVSAGMFTQKPKVTVAV
jgi:hypothetical protein